MATNKDFIFALTNGVNDIDGYIEVIRKGVADYLNLLVQIQVCIEEHRVPDDLKSWGFSDFDLFRYYMTELAEALEKHKGSTLIVA